MSIPNILSIFRMALVPVFLHLYLNAATGREYLLAAGILVLSALTYVLDGFIARRYHMITKLGQILDPAADKMTLAAVTLSLWHKIPDLWPLFAIFITKELLMVAGTLKLMHKKTDIAGAKWFGKLYTVIFYLVTVSIVAFPNLNHRLVFVMLAFMGIFTVFSFVMYVPVFLELNRK